MMQRKWDLHKLLVCAENVAASVENNLMVPQKLNKALPYICAIVFLGTHPKELKTGTETNSYIYIYVYMYA